MRKGYEVKRLVWGVNKRNIEIYNGRGKKLATISKDDLDIDQQIEIAKMFCSSRKMFVALCACLVEFEKFGLERNDPMIEYICGALAFTLDEKLTQRKTTKLKKAA